MSARPKVDDPPAAGAGGHDLVAGYEALRAVVLSGEGGRAGLGAALLMARGMAAWMRGWHACVPLPAPSKPACHASAPAEVVSVLAAMALACAEGG